MSRCWSLKHIEINYVDWMNSITRTLKNRSNSNENNRTWASDLCLLSLGQSDRRTNDFLRGGKKRNDFDMKQLEIKRWDKNYLFFAMLKWSLCRTNQLYELGNSTLDILNLSLLFQCSTNVMRVNKSPVLVVIVIKMNYQFLFLLSVRFSKSIPPLHVFSSDFSLLSLSQRGREKMKYFS